MENRKQLAKTCATCGIQKPLSAFLQLNEKQGAFYGNICNACRGTVPKVKSSDDSGGYREPSLELTIDNNTKVQMELEQKKGAQKQDELALESKKKREREGLTKTVRDETTEKSKDLIKSLEQKKSYLDYVSKKPEKGVDTAITKSIVREVAVRQSSLDLAVAAQHEHASQETRNQTLAAEQFVKENSINLSDTFTDPQQGYGQNKFMGVAWDYIKSVLGSNASMNTLDKMKGKYNKTTGEKSSTLTHAGEHQTQFSNRFSSSVSKAADNKPSKQNDAGAERNLQFSNKPGFKK